MKIIQIGANNGKDEVFDLISQNRFNIELAVLIEPIPFIIDDLKNQYKDLDNVSIESIAINDDPNSKHLTLYYIENSNYEVSSFNKEHVIEHKPEDETNEIKSLDIPCMTFNNIMEKYTLTDLDYLFIDTEGLDTYIINSIDFNKYNIQNIIFETIHADGPFTTGKNAEKTLNYLINMGYMLKYSEDGWDTMAIKIK
jgi:FkbM family methyltransferase